MYYNDDNDDGDLNKLEEYCIPYCLNNDTLRDIPPFSSCCVFTVFIKMVCREEQIIM